VRNDALDEEVRARLLEILDGRLTLAAFEEWFVARTWEDRTDLVAAVDHLLAEKDLLDVPTLTDEIRRLAATIRAGHAPEHETRSSSESVHAPPITIGNTTIRGRLALVGR
jgi:hypothetical protein